MVQDFQPWRVGNECAGPSGLAELEQLHVHVESNIELTCSWHL